MENIIPKLIYFIAHLLVDWIEKFYYFGLEFRDNFSNYIKYVVNGRQINQIKTSTNEKVIIEQHVHKLSKIPKHIAVILNISQRRDVDLSGLSDIVLWSLHTGVNFISFYDFEGTSNR